MTYAVRRATQTDAPLLPDIERSAGEAFLSIPELAWIASDDVQSEAQHRELIEHGAAWVASDAQGALVGFLNGEGAGEAFHVLEISVRLEAQGRGLGRALIDAAAEWAKHTGFTSLTLTTFADVPWNRPFYERHGFRTLNPAELSDNLRRIIELETQNGLVGRCAMVRDLTER